MSDQGDGSRDDAHRFDQTNGVLGTGDDADRGSDPDRAARQARAAALGATGAAGWGR